MPPRIPSSTRQKIGMFTGGGIAPGLNAVIAGATNALRDAGNDVVGIQEGWAGMIQMKELIDLTSLSRNKISTLLHKGGTILGTSRTKITSENYADVQRVAQKYGINGVIAIGGDDTLGQAAELHRQHILNIIGVPKTIDNDIDGTDRTFGFETAYEEARRHIERMRTEAKSMRRVVGVEIMGRDAGWITLYGGYHGGADITLIPEFHIPEEKLLERIRELHAKNGHVTIAIAEGYEQNGVSTEDEKNVDSFGHKKKGGSAKNVMNLVSEKTGIPTATQVPGYDVRNGPPIASDAEFASSMGATAGLLAHAKLYGRMVALRNEEIGSIPLHEVKGGKLVTEDFYSVEEMRKYDVPPNIVRQLRETNGKIEEAIPFWKNGK